jgi:cytoskeletal protein RodZ
MMSYEYTILFGYFLFIVGLIYMANNVEFLAEHPTTQAICNTFRYNLRDVPRINYKEISSDESESESDTESIPESESATEDEPTVNEVHHRRDRIPMSRIVSELLD